MNFLSYHNLVCCLLVLIFLRHVYYYESPYNEQSYKAAITRKINNFYIKQVASFFLSLYQAMLKSMLIKDGGKTEWEIIQKINKEPDTIKNRNRVREKRIKWKLTFISISIETRQRNDPVLYRLDLIIFFLFCTIYVIKVVKCCMYFCILTLLLFHLHFPPEAIEKCFNSCLDDDFRV